MNNFQKAVFLDIDGTLVTQGRGPFDDDIAQIEAARKQGHTFFLNTGRALANIPEEFQKAPWVDGIVAGGGAQVLLKEKNGGLKTIYHKWVPENILIAASAFYLAISKWCVFEGETALYAINLDGTGIKLNGVELLPIRSKNDFSGPYKGTFISKLTMDGIITKKEQALLGDYFYLYPQRGYFEGIIKGESKSKGMGIILEAAGIMRENSIAVGDSANDIDMIRFAGTGVAMGNACDELKTLAAFVTGGCGKGGVAQAIRHCIP
ncbi:MAG: Cof-type HAD-IIB family hydrolase [Treponema sp.]|jgi:Cof subfamily protein (haloacid dehalogenase superfamily)|nr:Cof-type HAD-IIB family hydrolase [Treponema sp.]